MNGLNEILILVVDDTPANIQVLASVLSDEGFNVACVLNWNEAEEFLKEELPDLILLDIMMPEINGFDACSRLKSKSYGNEIPVIFMSALTEISDKITGFKSGAVDYITKPFQKEEVIARVKTHITLKKSMETIKKQKEELEELNASKDKFFSIISHDMKNPIASLVGLTEIASIKAKKFGNEDMIRIIENLGISSKALNNLMLNLLDWSLIQRDKIEVKKSILNLKDIITECIELYANNIADKCLSVESYVDESYKIIFDENMIKAIIRNILSNSIKFTNYGGEINFFATKNDDGMIQLIIEDSGIGIEKEKISNLFKIDEVVSTNGTNNEKGTGLGLILCKEFIEKNGGKLSIESEVLKGSKFYLLLKNESMEDL